jgi:hypothetical protein
MCHRGLARVPWLFFLALLFLSPFVGLDEQPALPALAARATAGQSLGEEWAVQLVDKKVGPTASLALDYLGYPHVCYVRDGALLYAGYDGSTWRTRVIDPGLVGDFNALRLNAANLARIAYFDSYSTALKYAYTNGVTWKVEVVDNQGVAGWFVSLALDQQGNPHLSYYTYIPDFAVKYAYGDGLSWQIETVDADVGTLGGHTSIAVDASGVPPPGGGSLDRGNSR